MWFKPNRENWSENMSRYTPGMIMLLSFVLLYVFVVVSSDDIKFFVCFQESQKWQLEIA